MFDAYVQECRAGRERKDREEMEALRSEVGIIRSHSPLPLPLPHLHHYTSSFSLLPPPSFLPPFPSGSAAAS